MADEQQVQGRLNAPHTIWKFVLDVTDVQRVGMPTGAALLHVGTQRVQHHGPDTFGQWDDLLPVGARRSRCAEGRAADRHSRHRQPRSEPRR